MKTKQQAVTERLVAVLFGVQLLEDAVRKLAVDMGAPLPPGRVKLPKWTPVPDTAARAPRTASGGKALHSQGTKKRSCALIGCRRPNRTKGYCGAHYQKLRMLEKTGRRPAEWADYAAAGTVEDVRLPRGRAASKLLAKQRAQPKKVVRK